jgi:ABC-type dipeptide/oligopeptide/nickel transport system permease subunit
MTELVQGTAQPTPATQPTHHAPARRSTRLPEWLRLLLRNRMSAFGIFLLSFIVLVTIFAPLLTSQDPADPRSLPGQSPSWANPMGTTDQGYSVFAQVIYGGRISLLVALVATTIAMTIAIVLGLLAAYKGGLTDDLINLVANIFIVIPGLPLLIVIASFLKQTGPMVMALIIGFTTWAIETRVLRGQALSISNRDFILAARASGESTTRIVFRELLPNMLSRIAAGFAFVFINAVFFEAALEFLGFADVNKISWGTTLYWATVNSTLLQGEWWHFVFPGLAISLTLLSIVFINYGIDELADPRLRLKTGRGGVLRRLFRPRTVT